MLLTTFNSLSPFAKASSGLWPAYAKHKSLLRGCVGLWAPCAGVQGVKLYDFSRYGNIGVLTNMDTASDWIRPQSELYLDFDGTNDYVNCGTSDRLKWDGGDWSLLVWAKVRTYSNYRGIAGRGYLDSSYGYGIGIQASGVFAQFRGSATSNAQYASSSSSYQCLLAIRERGVTYLCSGGVVAATDSTAVAAGPTPGPRFSIGCRIHLTDTPGLYFDGCIGNVAVWNRSVLSQSSLLYNIGQTGIFDLDETAILAALKSGQLPLAAKYPPSYRYYTRRRWA